MRSAGPNLETTTPIARTTPNVARLATCRYKPARFLRRADRVAPSVPAVASPRLADGQANGALRDVVWWHEAGHEMRRTGNRLTCRAFWPSAGTTSGAATSALADGSGSTVTPNQRHSSFPPETGKVCSNTAADRCSNLFDHPVPSGGRSVQLLDPGVIHGSLNVAAASCCIPTSLPGPRLREILKLSAYHFIGTGWQLAQHSGKYLLLGGVGPGIAHESRRSPVTSSDQPHPSAMPAG